MFKILIIGPVSTGKTWFLNNIIEKFNKNIYLPEDQGRNTNCIYKIAHNDNPKLLDVENLKVQNENAKFEDEIEIQINMNKKDNFYKYAEFYDSPGFEEQDFKSFYEKLFQKKIDYKIYDLIVFITIPEKINACSAVVLKGLPKDKPIWLIINKITKPMRGQPYSLKTAKSDFEKLGVEFGDNYKFFSNFVGEAFDVEFYENLNKIIMEGFKQVMNSKISEWNKIISRVLNNNCNDKISDKIRLKFNDTQNYDYNFHSKWAYFKIGWLKTFYTCETEFIENNNDTEIVLIDSKIIYNLRKWIMPYQGFEIARLGEKYTIKDCMNEIEI